MREADILLVRIGFTGVAIEAAPLAANLAGSPHPVSRLNEEIRFGAPNLVSATPSAHAAKCSSDQESAYDLATYGALREPEAILPICLNVDAASHRQGKRPSEFRRMLALAR